jgi:hypothetical protein
MEIILDACRSLNRELLPIGVKNKRFDYSVSLSGCFPSCSIDGELSEMEAIYFVLLYGSKFTKHWVLKLDECCLWDDLVVTHCFRWLVSAWCLRVDGSQDHLQR